MTYPLNGLTVITPIIFFVLLFAFPVIGVFAGWKRAAYWGGGNLFFYILGLIIWRTAGPAISSAFIPLLQEKIGGSYDIQTLSYSLISPVFFLIMVLLGNIILVVCYYTFAKRLIGIGKYDKSKHPQKDKNSAASTKVVAQTKSGKVHVANTKWFNMVVGGVGLTALMLPITLTTVHTVAMTTTSVDTRKTNSLTSGLYNGLQDTSGNFNWFSYYNGKNAGNDYNFLFSSLAVLQTTITVNGVTYKGTEAFTKAIPDASTNFSNEINEIGTIDTAEERDAAAESTQEFINTINDVFSGLGTDNISAMVNSNGGQDLISSIIPGGSVKVSADQLHEQMTDEGSVTNALINAIKNEQDGKYTIEIPGIEGSSTVTAIQAVVSIEQEAYDKLLETTTEMFEVTGDVENPEQTAQEKKELADLLLKMMFEVK